MGRGRRGHWRPRTFGFGEVYDRNAAVNYANANWNKIVSDGYFWINGSTATYYGAGQPVPVNVPNEAGGIGDDCRHFVSSAIGSPPAPPPAVWPSHRAPALTANRGGPA